MAAAFEPHRLVSLLLEAAAGRFPPADFAVEVLSSPPGRADAVVAFSAHNVVACGLPQDEVRAALPSDDPGAPMDGRFLAWLSSRLGVPSGMVDLVLVAPREPPPGLRLVERRDASDHPRVRRATAYRSDVRVFSDPGGGGVAILGRGLGERLEVAIEVDTGARSRGLGRGLATAVLEHAPRDEPVFAQVSPGNVASVRTFMAAGYVPVCSESLFLRTPPGTSAAG